MRFWKRTPAATPQAASGRDNALRARHSVPLVFDTSGAPAAGLSLRKLEAAGQQGLTLLKRSEVASVSLQSRKLNGIRAKTCLVVDHSQSMMRLYESGVVQCLVERVAGFNLQVDVTGTTTVLPFDSEPYTPIEVTVDNYRNVVRNRIWRPRDMGYTDLAGALEVVLGYAKSTTVPLYVPIITDGNPEGKPRAKQDATDIICELSQYPVFLKFLSIKEVDYLVDLDEDDELPRLLDNVNTQFFNGRHHHPAAQPNWRPRVDDKACTDEIFSDAMTEEFDLWIERATAKHILTV
jgi:hypothetical protein